MENKKWKIFLVEDDKVIAEEIKRHLKFWVYEFKEAEHIVDAKAVEYHNKPSCIKQVSIVKRKIKT